MTSFQIDISSSYPVMIHGMEMYSHTYIYIIFLPTSHVMIITAFVPKPYVISFSTTFSINMGPAPYYDDVYIMMKSSNSSMVTSMDHATTTYKD